MSGRVRGGLHAALRRLVRDDEWVHVSLGIFGNATFVVGSVLFLWDSTQTAGVWLFIVGSLGMLVDSVGSALLEEEQG